jgi:hypothetical protein
VSHLTGAATPDNISNTNTSTGGTT